MSALHRRLAGFFHSNKGNHQAIGYHRLLFSLPHQVHHGVVGCWQSRSGVILDQLCSFSHGTRLARQRKSASKPDIQKLDAIVQQTIIEKHSPKILSRKLWTEEDDNLVYKLIDEGLNTFEALHFFPGRSIQSVDHRMSYARRARRPDGTTEAVLPIIKYRGDNDEDRIITATDGSKGKLKGKTQISQIERFKSAYPHRRRQWTTEEDGLLIDLVQKYAGQPGMWTLVAEATGKDGARILQGRAGGSCRTRWQKIVDDTKYNKGNWSAEETGRLAKAIMELTTTDITNHFSPKEQRKNQMEQGAAQFSSPSVTDKKDQQKSNTVKALRLEDVDWDYVTDAVGTRTIRQCKAHYRSRFFPSPNRGRWDTDELSRLQEAVKKYGVQWGAVARHVGTRSAVQAYGSYQLRRSRLEDNGQEEPKIAT